MSTYGELFKQIYDQDNPRTESGGWIQWKGTEVCMDVHCVCGHSGHFDGAFFYYFECPKCHAKYAVGQNVKLIPMSDEQASHPFCKDSFKTVELEEKDV